MIANQNKWHAARYGLDASLVDPTTMKAVTASEAARKLLELCRPFAHDLGCGEELEGINDILDHGTGAGRQVEVFQRTKDPQEVVRFLIEQLDADASIRPPDGRLPPAALA